MTTPGPLRIACSDPQLACELRHLLGHCEVIESPQDCSQAPLCRWLNDAEMDLAARMKDALNDTVATLERTRHAFRSRELGLLRRRLEQLLVELSAPPE
ncbi:hypothetical protein [Pseudomonas sp. Gutcm_11s]|uniref:hypothetical protein n=1 Tax=Pseudomonas sp. Gutcm_11s TaxID=3026088 RepID=UPI00235F7D35|nr:hypothetical protein [Pseudomonas sp. Gutcm_11s]MDD0844975.1 hypothetical protein [Pseudomonas sp. Gutcm_11s]